MLLLTGATGYLGGAVAAALSTRGDQFRCLARSKVSFAGAEWMPFDLSEIDALPSDAFSGVRVVVHCAGLAHRMASALDYERINVKATATLAKRAASAGVKHFVYLSSLNVVPPASSDPGAFPDAFPEQDEPYARSKRLAEAALLQVCEGSGMALTVIRPALMFDKELTANLAMLDRVLSWWPFLLPDAGCRCLVSRQDIVRLILACAESKAGAPVGQPVLVATDGECYSARAISQLLGPQQVNRDGNAFVMPVWLCQWACRLLDWRRHLSRGSTWRALSAEHWCGPATDIIGWRPMLTLQTRLRQG